MRYESNMWSDIITKVMMPRIAKLGIKATTVHPDFMLRCLPTSGVWLAGALDGARKRWAELARALKKKTKLETRAKWKLNGSAGSAFR